MKKLCVLWLALMGTSAFASTENLSYSMSILDVETNSLVLHYQTLPNENPQASAHWIGLWKGTELPADLASIPFEKAIPVNLPQTEGSVALNFSGFERGTPYTVVYFNSAGTSSPIVIVHFNPIELIRR